MHRLLLVVVAASATASSVASRAQTIVPVERQTDIEKVDIFHSLSPLAPAKSAATPTNESQPARPQAVAESEPPSSTVQFAENEPAASSPPANDRQPATDLPTASTVAAGTLPAPLSPKLQALLKPAPQPNGQPEKIPAHAPGAMTALSAEELRTLIGHAADEFHRELGELKHGERWQRYLKLEELASSCRGELDATAIESLPAIAKRFATLADDPQYIAVTRRGGYQSLHLALGEFLSLDDQRAARQQLLASSSKLQKSFADVGTGSQWAGFFELAALQRLAVSTTPVSEHDLVQLQLLLARFDQAATEAQYADVAKLDGFAATRGSLRNILGVAGRPAAPEIDLSAPQIADVDTHKITSDEFAVPDDASSPLAQASATLERAPPSGVQVVALGGKAFLRKPDDPAWKQIGAATAAAGDTIAARDETAQVVLGENFAVQLGEQTTLSLASRGDAEGAQTSLALEQGTVKAIANARGEKGQTLHLSRGDYELAVSGDDFAVEFRVENQDGRVVAIVHAGEAAIINKATGDRAVVCAGREAVLLSNGVALRGAPPKTANWWTTPADQPRSARRNGGFSR